MVNQVHIIGHTGAASEHFQSEQGTPYSKFSVATDSKRGDKTITQWHSVTIFGPMSGIRLVKGDLVDVIGTLEYYKDKNNNQRAQITAHRLFKIVKQP